MLRRTLIVLALLLLIPSFVSAEAPPSAEVAPAWSASLSGVPLDGGGSERLVLQRVDFEVDVLGPLAVGMLVQDFTNESGADVAATYTGRAPSGMRVTSIEIDRGGVVEELTPEEPAPNKKAKPTGRNARQQRAKTATLPSFEVESGETVSVRAIFEMSVPIVDGRFKLSLPAVGGASSAGQDAPTLPPAGTIQVRVHHDEPLLVADSDTHDVFVSYSGDFSLVELAEGDSPSRPFRLELAMGSENDPNLLGFVGPETESGGREVLMVLAPPSTPRDGSIRPKQVLFVLDTSGSMANGKLEEARAALAGCLAKLRPEDGFNVFEFDTNFTAMSPEAVMASEATLQTAGLWLGSLKRGGGTQLLPALTAALEQAEQGSDHRMVVILTDGAMQDRQAVLSMLQQRLGDTRLFVVGIGADVQQETIKTIAAYGRGTAAFAADPAGLNAAVTSLFDSVSAPLAWDLAVDWQGAEVELIEPRRIPDLYAGRPVTIRATVKGDVPAELSVQASTMDGPTSFTVRMPDADVVMPRFSRPKARSSAKGQR